MLVTRKKQPAKNEHVNTLNQTNQSGLLDTKGTKGFFVNPKTSLTTLNADKTFLFKAGTSRDSAPAGDNGRKTHVDNMSNMPKDRVKIRIGGIGSDGLISGNELGCHLSQTDGTCSSPEPSTKSSKSTSSTSTSSSSISLHGPLQQKATNPPLLRGVEQAQTAISVALLGRVGVADTREKSDRFQGFSNSALGEFSHIEIIPSAQNGNELRSPGLLQRGSEGDTELPNSVEARLGSFQRPSSEDGMEHDSNINDGN
nr:hypothetical protein CFP56_15811 [Quercus suber]